MCFFDNFGILQEKFHSSLYQKTDFYQTLVQWIDHKNIDLKLWNKHVGGYLRFLEIRKIKVQQRKSAKGHLHFDQVESVCCKIFLKNLLSNLQ